jgi:hypothetical protein
MPNSLLTINFASIFDVQNTSDVIAAAGTDLQKDDITVTPFILARYFLYSRELSDNNFGQDDSEHLSYEGGFLTCEDRVNTKYSDFTINETLTVNLSSFLNKGFDMADANNQKTNRILNVRRVPNIVELTSTGYDSYALTVGDFKKYSYYPGMIVMWSGTYADLVSRLPYWRLCATPEAGTVVNGVSIPNLQNRFIMGGSYSGYQSLDNYSPQRPFGSTTTIGSTNQGSDTVTLTLGQLPSHIHNNRLTVVGGYTDIYGADGGPLTFVTGGGGLTTSAGGHASGGTGALASATRDNWLPATLKLALTNYTYGKVRENFRGGTPSMTLGQCNFHENRPPFYALAYIIYIGVNR